MQTMSNEAADTDADGIRTKSNMSPLPFSWGDIILSYLQHFSIWSSPIHSSNPLLKCWLTGQGDEPTTHIRVIHLPTYKHRQGEIIISLGFVCQISWAPSYIYLCCGGTSHYSYLHSENILKLNISPVWTCRG